MYYQTDSSRGTYTPLGPKGTRIRHIDVMFANTKPYRELFRRSFDAIVAIHSYQVAQEWRELVYTTFVRTHWVLPNPTERDFWPKGIGNRLPLWCTTYLTLLQYLRRDIIGYTIGWERSEAAFTTTLPLGYRVELILPSLPTGLISEWVSEGIQDSAEDDRPLIPALNEDGEISQWIYANFSPRYALRQLTQRAAWSPENLIKQPWLITDYSDSLRRKLAAEDRALSYTLSTDGF
ncbi:hypothetical protein N7523_008393 [Penicillium sp. IBT 18751x]|nr:hypothetical protein N7523_008393 [Penicillium sp. IBT 18751x]